MAMSFSQNIANTSPSDTTPNDDIGERLVSVYRRLFIMFHKQFSLTAHLGFDQLLITSSLISSSEKAMVRIRSFLDFEPETVFPGSVTRKEVG